MKPKSETRGGARAGAGRKTVPKKERSIPVCYSLKPDVIEAVENLSSAWKCSRAQVVSRAILRIENHE